jgi:dipeptide/tripeptide permease
VVLTFLALATAAIGACEGPFWIVAIDLGGRRGGTAAAFCNTGGNVGGFLAPVVTPWVGEHYGWTTALALASAICLAGAALWWWVNPHERMDNELSEKRA